MPGPVVGGFDASLQRVVFLYLQGSNPTASTAYTYDEGKRLPATHGRGLKDTEQHPLIDEWYHTFNDRLVGFLSQAVRAPADVQDLAQEIYLRLLRAKNPELIEAPRAYLYRIAIHVLDEWRTKEKRAMLHSSEGLSQLVGSIGTPDDPNHRDMVVDLQKALSALPANFATTLLLRWHHGMGYREIAEHLEVTERMVKRYMVKGYAELRVRLGPETDRLSD